MGWPKSVLCRLREDSAHTAGQPTLPDSSFIDGECLSLAGYLLSIGTAHYWFGTVIIWSGA